MQTMMADSCHAKPTSNGKRYTAQQLDELAEQFKRDSFVVLKEFFDKEKVTLWNNEFAPLLKVNLAISLMFVLNV